MIPNENSPQSRANDLWKRFVGMFGGDSVERKYGLTPPPEWIAMVGRLKGFELDRGVRRLAYSGAVGMPSLPAFTKLCRAVGDDSVDEGPKPIALPNPDTWQGDEWDMTANRHLLAYLMRGVLAKRTYTPAETQVLVAYKKAWSQDMREWGVNQETGEILVPSVEDRKRTWEECIQRAETDIAALRRKAAA